MMISIRIRISRSSKLGSWNPVPNQSKLYHGILRKEEQQKSKVVIVT
jgi:hypothetical protein